MKWDELTNEQKNRLIHEKVFGIPVMCPGNLLARRVDTPSRAGGIAFTYWELACDTCETVGTANSEYAIPKEHSPQVAIPAYSTDMNAAWRIVEHLKKVETSIHVQEDFYHWLKAFSTPNPYDETNTYLWWIYGVNPDRICKAALKAERVEIE